jgi:hypothetical protein
LTIENLWFIKLGPASIQLWGSSSGDPGCLVCPMRFAIKGAGYEKILMNTPAALFILISYSS